MISYRGDCPACNEGCGDKHVYGCDSTSSYRPIDFASFRAKLVEYGLDKNLEGGRSIFMDMADYLERNPNMFVNFNC